MLGPSSLDHRLLRTAIKQKKYKELANNCNAGKIQWKDKALDALKQQIRLVLRSQQDGRCIYCRRLIIIERRNVYEDIEHFLDKSKSQYVKWSLSCVNLSLSCHACNFEKSTREMGDAAIQASPSYTSTAGIYKWLHPYFDDYHQNIKIRKGWVYSVKQNAPQRIRAENLITECKLDHISRIEAHSQTIKDNIYRLTLLMGKAQAKGRNGLLNKLLQRSLQMQRDGFFT
jgi:uncharacterized protein (TIGR02646 family)